MSTLWDEVRTPTAFLVAPLAVPLILAVQSSPFWRHDTIVATCTLVAYLGMAVFGIPLYGFLCARRLTAFWIAPLTGFVAGGAMLYASFALIALALGGMSSMVSSMGDPLVSSDVVRIGGSCGAAVGTILWLIARPDRRAQ